MKKTLWSIALLCLIFCFFAGALCEAGAPMMKVVNCKEWVSLRESPSLEAKRLLKVPLNALVYPSDLTGKDGFAPVAYRGIDGFIESKYLAPVTPEDLEAMPYAMVNYTEGITQLSGNSLIDLNGDGTMDRVSFCITDDSQNSLTIFINGRQTQQDMYIWFSVFSVYVTDIDRSDEFLELVTRDSGYSGDAGGGYGWRFYRYDGSNLVQIPIEQDFNDEWMLGRDMVTQSGWSMGVEPPIPEIPGNGTMRFVLKDILAGSRYFSAYCYVFDSDLEYVLVDGKLVLQNAERMHEIASMWEEKRPRALMAEVETRLYREQDTASDTFTVGANVRLRPVSASLSGWFCLETPSGERGYLLLTEDAALPNEPGVPNPYHILSEDE